MSDCICLGACFGPNGTPDTWAELVAAERALADAAADVFLNYADEGYDFDTARSQWLDRHQEARQR